MILDSPPLWNVWLVFELDGDLLMRLCMECFLISGTYQRRLSRLARRIQHLVVGVLDLDCPGSFPFDHQLLQDCLGDRHYWVAVRHVEVRTNLSSASGHQLHHNARTFFNHLESFPLFTNTPTYLTDIAK